MVCVRWGMEGGPSGRKRGVLEEGGSDGLLEMRGGGGIPRFTLRAWWW